MLVGLIDWIVVTGLITGSLGMVIASALYLRFALRRRTTHAPFPPPSLRWFPYLLLASGVNFVILSLRIPYVIPHPVLGGTEVIDASAAAMMISGGLVILAALLLIALGRRSAITTPSDGG